MSVTTIGELLDGERRWCVLPYDCVDLLDTLVPENSIDAVVTDPPYGLEFMGKDWDRLGRSGVQRKAEEGAGDRRAIVDAGAWAGGESNPYSRSRVRWQHGDSGPPAMQAWHQEWARAVLRVLKPGGHLLAFGGTRTYHRLACALEDAGFEIRDCLAWLYGSGFPKSLDVSKAIDNAAGAERTDGAREWVGGARSAGIMGENRGTTRRMIYDAPATEEARRWQGWGTALKPAFEPIVLARKPLAGTVATNVSEYGTGALNIDASRIGFAGASDEAEAKEKNRHADFGSGPRENRVYGPDVRPRGEHGNYDPTGRWPANVALGHAEDCRQVGVRSVASAAHWPDERGPGGISTAGHVGQSGGEDRRPQVETVEAWECVEGCPVRMLDEQSGATRSVRSDTPQPVKTSRGIPGGAFGNDAARHPEGHPVNPAYLRGGYEDAGGASRFFYVPKADREERNRGLEGFADRPLLWSSGEQNPGSFQAEGTRKAARNNHPTVKPVELMQWLCRLVTPPGGVVLDPFAGRGSTGIAALREGFRFFGIERDAEYVAIARARIVGDAPLFNSADEPPPDDEPETIGGKPVADVPIQEGLL